MPWYKLPALYRANRAAFLAANESYSFQGLWRDDPALPLPRQDAGAASLPAARLTGVGRRRAGRIAADVRLAGSRAGRIDALWTAIAERLARCGDRRPDALDRSRALGRGLARSRPRPLADLRLSVLDAAARNRAARRNAGLRRSGLRGPVLFEHDRRAQRRTGRAACRPRTAAASPTTQPTASPAIWRFGAAMKEAGLDRGLRDMDRDRQPPRLGPRRRRGEGGRRGDRRRLLGARASLRAGGGVAAEGHRRRRRSGRACRFITAVERQRRRSAGDPRRRSRTRSPIPRRWRARQGALASPASARSTSGTTARSPLSAGSSAERFSAATPSRASRG